LPGPAMVRPTNGNRRRTPPGGERSSDPADRIDPGRGTAALPVGARARSVRFRTRTLAADDPDGPGPRSGLRGPPDRRAPAGTSPRGRRDRRRTKKLGRGGDPRRVVLSRALSRAYRERPRGEKPLRDSGKRGVELLPRQLAEGNRIRLGPSRRLV